MISTITTTIDTIATTQVLKYSIISSITLIGILATKEIISAEKHKNKKNKSFVEGSNVAIVPLFLVFAAVLTYKIVTLL